jgi:hypothetical protein
MRFKRKGLIELRSAREVVVPDIVQLSRESPLDMNQILCGAKDLCCIAQ